MPQALAALGGSARVLDVDRVLGEEPAARSLRMMPRVIVASHGSGEEPALEAALRAGVPYVALVASRVRGAAVLASLDVDDEQRARVHSPAGLLLGGHTPGGDRAVDPGGAGAGAGLGGFRRRIRCCRACRARKFRGFC